MAALGMVVCLVGGIAGLVGGIMILIKAFQKSILWGLGSLIVPFVILVFAVMNMEDCKKGLLIMLAGIVVQVLGMILMAMGGGGEVVMDGANVGEVYVRKIDHGCSVPLPCLEVFTSR